MTKRQEIVSKIGYYCFYAAVIIEVLIVLVDKSNYTNPMQGRLFQFTFLLTFIKVCLTRYTKKEYVVIVLFLCLGAISYFVADRNEIIRFVMFIAACKNIDMIKCLKLVFYMTLAGCMIIIFLSLTGIYGGVSLTQDYGRGSQETRYTLGMGHPNALQCMVWALTTLGLYLYGNKMKWHHYLLVLAVNVGFFFLTDSRTSLLVAIVVIALAYMASEKRKVIIQKISGYLEIGITVLSIVVSIIIACNAYRVYNYAWSIERSPITTFFAKINDILNGRIRILVGNKRFEGTVSTWTLFSSPENNYYFDMGWIRLFYWYGIVPAAIFILALLIVMLYYKKQNQILALMLIASFALYTVIEAHAVSEYLGRNYILFLAGGCWYKIVSEGKGTGGVLGRRQQ